MPLGVALGPPTVVEAWWLAQAPDTQLRGVPPISGVAVGHGAAAATSVRGAIDIPSGYVFLLDKAYLCCEKKGKSK